MFDVDDYVKTDCVCGHRRYHHEAGDGRCRKTKMQRVTPPDLPAPVYADGAVEWWDSPINWPPYSEWPEVEVPCCTRFFDAGEAAAEAELM